MPTPRLSDELAQQAVDLLELHGNVTEAAMALGIPRNTFDSRLKSAKLRGFGTVTQKQQVMQGWSPAHDLTVAIPQPLVIRGTSSLYKDGELKLQWVKTKLSDQLAEAAMKAAISAFMDEIPPVKVSLAPLDYQNDIIPWIQIGDAHLGMLAYSAEIGENYDLKIAETEICAAISILIDELPMCERIVVNDLGDFTHYENFTGTTEASGHALDYDSRFPKMIKVYSRVMRFVIEKALSKAHHVDVIINQGNHSRTNDIWMAELLRVAYGHTERVHVLNNDSVFIAYRMGKTLVMTHHSDKCKPARLVNVMTSDYRKDYGETEFHYIDVGHVHHGMVMKEHPDIFVESFNHLASLDRWAHDSGYRNRKSITTILRSKTYGEVGRRVLPIQEIRDRLMNAKQSTPFEREVFTV